MAKTDKALGAGKKAPLFKLNDKDGNPISLKDLKSDYAIVYFYPKDNTPGCTIEAKQFSKELKKLKDMGAEVIGISGGNEKSKTKFCKANKLSVTLVSDPDFSVCKEYGVYGKKKFMGREYMGIFRKTFLLDKSRKIIKVYDEVSPGEHAKEILEDLKGL